MISKRSWAAYALISIAAIALSVLFGSAEIGLWVAAACVALGVFFFICALRNRSRLRDLAFQIDTVLHNGRTIVFSNYSEGDMAILANELDKLVAKLSLTTEQLKKEKTTLSDELTDISHQIRTPLTAISLMIPLIERSEDPTERKELLRQLETMIDRMSWLVASLLKMAKVEAGALAMESKDVSVEEVVSRALSPMELLMDIRDVAYDTDIQGKPSFCGDAFWTAEAIQNVVKNCIEHTPAGGKILVTAREDALATRITIQDTGRGIDQKDLPHLFERFYRGDAPDRAEGFGVGLSLSKSLVVAQGGSIRAGNITDASGCTTGARFDISFPKITVL